MKAKCKRCGCFMMTAHIECCVFPMCNNPRCTECGKWPKALASTEKYYRDSCDRGSFISSPSIWKK